MKNFRTELILLIINYFRTIEDSFKMEINYNRG
jgi:hypothetical protein